MRTENYERLELVGLILTIILIASFSVAWLREPIRMEDASAELTKSSVLRGRTVYNEQCTSCHGSRGEGGAGPALNNKIFLESVTNVVLVESISAGRPGTIMPAWSQKNGGPLTDEDMHDLANFIRAWEPNAPVVKTDEFIANAARGLTLYNSSCFICHGEYGSGGEIAPAINDPSRLDLLDNDWYRATITNGRPAKGMPTWGTVLSPNQVEDLIALLDAWRAGEQVIPETTVTEMLNSALFALSQADVEDTLFYLNRAEPLAFGPGLDAFAPIRKSLEDEQLDDALDALGQLAEDWPMGDSEAGADIYADGCRSCHGDEGQGGVGVRLAPNDFMNELTNSKLLRFLLDGREGTAMRGFDGRFNEKQLADVIAFLRLWQIEE